MSNTYLLQRRREFRLRRFGLVLGLILALVFHLILFWGPRVGYQPILEQARVRRVLVARPYQPAPPPPVPRPRPAPKKAKVNRAPQPAPAPMAPVALTPPAPPATPGADLQKSVAQVPETVPETVRARPRGEDETTRTPASQDAWDKLLGSLANRQQDIEQEWAARRQEIASQAAQVGAEQTTWGAGGSAAEGDSYLDSRIRMTVVAYPQTAIETDYLPIPYPDLRFRRAQLQTGICRVYYRVWVDGRGEIVRTQLKTPSTKAEREKFSVFVDQVIATVAEWPFPHQQGEIHIDVYFQIE